jgi:thiol-disulfide isomerase/thioredoxin
MIKEIFTSDITTNSGSNYILKAKGTGGILMVKQDWCGYCVRALPAFEESSKKLGSAYPIFKMDGDKNKAAVSKLGVQGFPTILFIDRNGKIGKKYEGDRTTGDILSSVCKESLVCKK